MHALIAPDEFGSAGPTTWSRLGIELLNEGRYCAAAAVLNEAVRRHPADGRIWFDLGRAYYQLGRFTEAQAALLIAQLNHGPLSRIKLYLDRIAEMNKTRSARCGAGEEGSVGAVAEAERREEALLSDGGGAMECR